MSCTARSFVRRLLLVLTILAGTPVLAAAQQGDEPEVYRLGPTDEIGLRVVVWDSATLTFADLAAISGVYTVALDGTVMLPIVGAVPAEGTSTIELAEQIAFALKQSTGLSETPSVAIEILAYRPVFVLGDVARPGEYPYRPKMRAVQLLALAGGYFRVAEDQSNGFVREGIRLAGSLRENRIDLTAARIREARLLAEADGASDFALPTGLTHPNGASSIDQIYQREKNLLTTRRKELARAVESLESSRSLLETEGEVLLGKRERIDKQVALMSEVVGNLETLRERGLTVSANLVNMQRALFDVEARQLDTNNQVFRAGQSMGEIERDLNEVTQRRATEILNELQELQQQIARLQVRSSTNQRMLVETQGEAALAAEDDSPELVPEFLISREIDGEVVTETVDKSVRLRPLDVLEVRWTDSTQQ